MEPPYVPLLMLSIIIHIVLFAQQASVQFSFRHSECDGDTYTANSPYQTNLKTVLNALSSDTKITYGFYNFTAGQDPNKVHSLAICRGDVPVGTCRVCIRDSANLISQTCPNQKEALGYSEYCTIYLSNRSIYGNVQYTPQWHLTNSDVISDPAGFNKSLNGLVTKLQNQAAAGNSELKYASGQVNLKGGQTLYGLVQRTPDLSGKSRTQCIQNSITFSPTCCVNPLASGVKIVKPSCFLQYDITPFFGNVRNLEPPPPPPQPASPSVMSNTTSTEDNKDRKSLNVSVIVIPVVASTIIVIAALLCILQKRKKLRKSRVKFSSKPSDFI